MGMQEFQPISKIFSWIFLFTSLNFCPGINCAMNHDGLWMNENVYVSFSGESVRIQLILHPNAGGQLDGSLKCVSPTNVVVHTAQVTALIGKDTEYTVILNRLKSVQSGEYNCVLNNSTAFWTVLVRDKAEEEDKAGGPVLVSRGMIVVGTLTAVLGVASVAGSLYILKDVLSGAKRGGQAAEGEAGEGREEEDEDPTPKGAMETATASVYASLEPRLTPIYDTLEPSEVRRQSRPGLPQDKAADSSPQGTKEKKTPYGDQSPRVDESVYENL
ncbi:hypothetical protein NHX12_018673 [Muraenolepis orangiensis]|uniref:Uncharacterized protein n=1 Tax=Muraenolepis orangiensis TaxID=630683 RepID=A0A9Q0EX93_9TELE|nr:hypothetical protein NHX12_018673 [Muraenolepis orangiensis]